MSKFEVVSAVAAIISAFHDGTELVAQIKKKSRRRKSEQEFQEKQLQDSLQAGEIQVGQQYAADLKELGEMVRIGDAIARDRLLHIAVVMQSEIIRSLQLAVTYEYAVLNLTILHEASIVNRKDTIATLDELKQRILITRPLERTLAAVPEKTTTSPTSTSSFESVQTFRTAPEDLPAAVTIPTPGDSQGTKTGLAKYFSMKRNASQSSSSTSTSISTSTTSSSSPSSRHRPVSSASSITFSPALNYLIQGSNTRGSAIMKDIDEIISSYQGLNLAGDKRDTLALLNGGGLKRDTLAILQADGSKRDTLGLNREALQLLKSLPPTPEEADMEGNSEYPAFNHNIFDQSSVGTQYFAGPQHFAGPQYFPAPQHFPTPNTLPERHHESRLSTSSSVYSDTLPPSLYDFDSDESPMPPAVTHFPTYSPPISFVPPFAVPSRPHTPIKEDSGSLKAGRTRVHLVPSQGYESSISDKLTISRPVTPTPGIVHTNSHGSSKAPSIRSNNIKGPTVTQDKMMDGRPCKDNNYWGFCKGAWAVREELKKGLSVQTRPDGMYSSHQVWQCKHCHFTGETFQATVPGKKKKETVVDRSIRISSVGIRYKWIFLAKSHVKKKTMDSATTGIKGSADKEECNYGCVICSVEGNVTGIYGNVETLFNHIFLEHVRSMSDKTVQKAKCIMGREAKAEEEWDINVPWMDAFMAESSFY
ncbi:hypothetical protein K469DRAFT_746440 [Zopfia rhizophila CBS 207.26]|uniref:Uncharacterized protein n=1 Tax=Zopfia rhizophila CBS 207.26 TaxID=1314779 RepID=A0A6A6EJR0_9PEZI|nr:hypothetical protein K469DRAFT_746440 [Zopfia rhizophila CBS 207.26]